MDSTDYTVALSSCREAVTRARKASKDLQLQWSSNKKNLVELEQLKRQRKKGATKAIMDAATAKERSSYNAFAAAAAPLKAAEAALMNIERTIAAATTDGTYHPEDTVDRQSQLASISAARAAREVEKQNDAIAAANAARAALEVEKQNDAIAAANAAREDAANNAAQGPGEVARKKGEEDRAAALSQALGEAARRKAEEDKVALDAAARKEEEDRLVLEEAARKKAEEDRLVLEEAVRKKAEEDRLVLEEAARKKSEEDRLVLEEAVRKKAEEDRLVLEEAARKKSEEDRLLLEEAARKKAEDDGAAAQAQAQALGEAARKKVEEDRASDEAAKRKAEEDMAALEDAARKKAEEERAVALALDEATRKKAEDDRAALEETARQRTEADRIAAQAVMKATQAAEDAKKREQQKQTKATMKRLHKAQERELVRKEKEKEREEILAVIEGKRKAKRKRTDGDVAKSDATEGGADPEEESQKPKKAKSLPITERYLASSPNRQEEMRMEARGHIQRFMKDYTYSVPFKFRRLIRELQDFLPEVSRLCRALTLHCLETKPGNIICPYHAEKDKNGKIFDGSPDSKYEVTGTPYERDVKGPEDEEIPRRYEGYLHCGCPEDEVLVDFMWWKCTLCLSPSTGVEEGMQDQRLDPRTRTFMYSVWCRATGQTAEDIFVEDKTITDFRIFSLKKQIAGFQEVVDELEEKKRRSRERKKKALLKDKKSAGKRKDR